MEPWDAGSFDLHGVGVRGGYMELVWDLCSPRPDQSPFQVPAEREKHL